MPHGTSGLADNVRKYRRTSGMSQEALAHDADVSISVVRKIEQGGDARVETLHKLARALGVTTSALFAAEAPKPVVGDEDNRRYLVSLRAALMPPVGISGTTSMPEGSGAAPVSLATLHREVAETHALHYADEFGPVAKRLPGLLRTAEATVQAAEDGEERQRAEIARAHVLLLAGKHLTQVRQYDMAYHALTEGIRLAREQGQTLTAATGVTGLCWLLLRQDRFDEAEHLATMTADQMEPRITAAPAEHAVWGELALRIAASAARNNQPDRAKDARRMAATAAGALGREHSSFPTTWGSFGPVTVELKVVEDLSLAGDSRGVLRRADEDVLSGRSLARLGRPSPMNWGRHRLDVARAHVRLHSHQDAMDELIQLRESSGEWLRHQPMARYVMTDILKTRKRTLTQDMREMAAHLGVVA